jgi:hypothetical protein
MDRPTTTWAVIVMTHMRVSWVSLSVFIRKRGRINTMVSHFDVVARETIVQGVSPWGTTNNDIGNSETLLPDR